MVWERMAMRQKRAAVTRHSAPQFEIAVGSSFLTHNQSISLSERQALISWIGFESRFSLASFRPGSPWHHRLGVEEWLPVRLPVTRSALAWALRCLLSALTDRRHPPCRTPLLLSACDGSGHTTEWSLMLLIARSDGVPLAQL
jgi:hypothetical protein